MAVDARPLEATLSATRTLVILPNWVGDNVMSIPVLEAIARTDRQLAVLARAHLEPLLRLVPAVDEIVIREKSDRATVRRLKERNFEEAIILPNSFRSAWLAFRASVPVRWGYSGDFRSPLLEPAVARPEGSQHQLADYNSLLERLGATPPVESPRLVPSSEARREARVQLEHAGLEPGPQGSVIGLFPGAEFGPSKRWRPSNFAALSRQLFDQSRQPLLIAGPQEQPLVAAIQSEAGRPLPILGPELDLAELAALLAELDLLVTNDSGPMHVAAAVGTRCLALFGPTDPTRTAPSGDAHQVLYTDRWCSPCFKKRCPLLHQRCLRDISVDRVERQIREMLVG